jgi:hypothetical protein
MYPHYYWTHKYLVIPTNPWAGETPISVDTKISVENHRKTMGKWRFTLW